MIVDTSVLVSILDQEPEAERLPTQLPQPQNGCCLRPTWLKPAL